MIGQAAILCGGRGIRSGAITANTPKPLLPVGETPFLEVLVFELAHHGIKKILLLAGFQAHNYRICDINTSEITIWFGDRRVGRIATGRHRRALWRARDKLEEIFFLLNGDCWFDVNLLALAGPVAEDPSTAGIIALRRVDDTARFEVVELSGRRVVGFAERPAQRGSGLISGGSMC